MAREDSQPLQGMSDLTTPEVALWQTLEAVAREVFDIYGFTEIRTPLLERTEIFVRSLGDTTDVVQKEMYTFADRGDRSVTLRPEGTAGVVRSIAGLGPEALESRVFYFGPMFRAERPQAGRKRQFHQVGAESLGGPNAYVDAECIAMQAQLLRAWNLDGFEIQVNTRGLPEDRQPVADGLRAALGPLLPRLCDDCRRRFENNVLRTLDCKQATCRATVAELPPISGLMSEASRRYFEEVLGLLELLNIPFTVQPRLVRGLDYYCQTVWEITHPSLGAQDAISGGGRYRIEFDGKQVEGVGFAMGIERVVAALCAQGLDPAALVARPHVWLVSLGEQAIQENLKLLQDLRHSGVGCRMDFTGRGMKAQMRSANRSGADWVIIRGETELENGTCILKDMHGGTQEEVAAGGVIAKLSSE